MPPSVSEALVDRVFVPSTLVVLVLVLVRSILCVLVLVLVPALVLVLVPVLVLVKSNLWVLVLLLVLVLVLVLVFVRYTPGVLVVYRIRALTVSFAVCVREGSKGRSVNERVAAAIDAVSDRENAPCGLDDVVVRNAL